MGLLQKAPATPAEAAKWGPLETSPEEVLEYDEDRWYAEVYRGADAPQLTVRALLMGTILGFALSFTNLYVGLKAGWHLGVAVTACILSFAVWEGFLKIGFAKTRMTILENNCMASTASAAGYSTGGTMVSAISALLMLSATTANPQGTHLPWAVLASWTFFLAALGVFLAIPMKRNMINQERLRFPTGMAAAVTLHGLYSTGGEAVRKAKALFAAGIVGAITPILFVMNLRRGADGVGHSLLPDSSPIFDPFARGATYSRVGADGTLETIQTEPSQWTMVMDHNIVMIGAGALVGLRVCFWMLVSHLFLAYVLGPAAASAAWTNAAGDVLYAVSTPGKAWKEIGVWTGAPIMVASGLLAFALGWKTIVRAFRGFGGGDGGDEKGNSLRAATEVPASWFFAGSAVAGAGIVFIAQTTFGVPVHLGVMAVLLTFVLALVACRATGESDITPTGAMGKIMQLTYGMLIPQNSTANLMTAGITAGAAASSADLLTDLKGGYLLGANPRRQFAAQFLGIFAGTAATVTGFHLLVQDATVLTGKTLADGSTTVPVFPAPAAQAWRAVAELFEMGLENLHPMSRAGIFWGLAAGAIMVLLEKALPKWRKWLPSATGVGLGLILPFQYPLSMFLGALGAWTWTRANKKAADEYTIPVASGIIAGESLMGVLAQVMNNFVIR
ncbi:MAG TPA: OPT family oligopeptide transporter [Planctomycetota bacterium]